MTRFLMRPCLPTSCSPDGSSVGGEGRGRDAGGHARRMARVSVCCGKDSEREKPPRPEGHSGLSFPSLWMHRHPVNPTSTLLSLFLDANASGSIGGDPLDSEGGGLEPVGVGID